MRSIAGQGLLVTIESIQGDSRVPTDMYAVVKAVGNDRRFETPQGPVRAGQTFIALMRKHQGAADPKSDFNRGVKEMWLEGLAASGQVVSLDGVEIVNHDELEFSTFERTMEIAA